MNIILISCAYNNYFGVMKLIFRTSEINRMKYTLYPLQAQGVN